MSHFVGTFYENLTRYSFLAARIFLRMQTFLTYLWDKFTVNHYNC